MKKSKVISLLLSLAMLASAAIPGTLAVETAAADDEQGNKGMEISKTATDNGDGTYTITLEAYATGEKITSTIEKDVPTDIVLVLDQSGSMANNMNTYGFREYTNQSNSSLYNKRHNDNDNNGNLYYQLDDGSYATVSVVRTQGESTYNYTLCPADWKNDKAGSWNEWDPDDYWKHSNNLYVKVGEEYKKVTLKRDWVSEGQYRGYYKYTYKFPDESIFVSERGDTSPENFGGKGPLYYLSGTTPGEYTYTYTCTDKDGVTQTIGSSTGQNTVPTEFTLYERYVTSTTTRLAALQTAVTTFAESVYEKAAGKDGIHGNDDDIDHRIAVVGFATGNYSEDNNYPTYENTELFIGRTQYNYNVNANQYYGSAFQDMRTQDGYNNVIASKNALAARGATYPNYGLEMANGIFDKYPIPEKEKRNRVVVLFTDGAPGYSGYDSDVADLAVKTAKDLKNAGVTVYSVGIFSGADATSVGIAQENSNRRENQFMQNVSSNNGTPRNPSYYLSAADADTLNDIFEQIANNIESGGSSTTLDEEAIIKDIISPQFTLPEGATSNDITLKTYSYTSENQWTENTNNSMGATATVNGDKVDVTGFDFSENWCGTETNNGNTTYRGNKLVISFKVKVKDGFLGGNGVYTNTSAGVYKNSSAQNPVMEFERPQVDVAIEEVTVTAPDKNVYLLQDVSIADLINGATANAGNVGLDLTKPTENWGLQSWQNEYVDITVEIKDKSGNVITNNLASLTEDSEYTVSVKVSPKTTGTAKEKNREKKGNIYVFKPTLTYKDSEVYYGDAVPTDFSGNLVSTRWLHGETEADTTKMGEAPVLSATYTPDASKIDSGKINSKQDVPVPVELQLGNQNVNQFVNFQHQACSSDSNCGWTTLNPNNGNPAFLLHVKTCKLTIAKTGGASGEPYVFNVYKDGEKYSEVTIEGNDEVTIYDLPVGTYTIKEDTGWSWRYTPNYSESVGLSAVNHEGTITCTNSRDKDYWLNGFSGVVKNTLGIANEEGGEEE